MEYLVGVQNVQIVNATSLKITFWVLDISIMKQNVCEIAWIIQNANIILGMVEIILNSKINVFYFPHVIQQLNVKVVTEVQENVSIQMCTNLVKQYIGTFLNKDIISSLLSVLINSSEYDIDRNLTTSKKGYKGILRLELFLKFSRNAQSIYYEVTANLVVVKVPYVEMEFKHISPSWSKKMSPKYDNRNIIRKLGTFS